MTTQPGDTVSTAFGILAAIGAGFLNLITLESVFQAIVLGAAGGVGGWLVNRLLNKIFKNKQ